MKNNDKKIEFHKRIPLETIPNTFFAIFRNKRRSLAMLSGIVLSMTLLSGIILYNAELKQNNYESMVKNYPYEVDFSIQGSNSSYENLATLSAAIENDDRTLDATIIGRSSADVFSIDPKNSSEFLYGGFRTYFVDEDYFTESIGETLLSMDFKGNANLSGQSVIVSEGLLNEFSLKIGDKLHTLNFSEWVWDEEAEESYNEVGTLANLTIVGSYKPSFPDDLIGFGNPIDGNNIYLSLDLLTESKMTDINQILIEEGSLHVMVKIDVTKFSVGDPATFNKELNLFINQISRDIEGFDTYGNNLIGGTIMFFQVISVLITILYIVLAIPVILLSLYLLNFGLEMSLEERRRLIAIKKVQGASGKQIFSELKNEIFLTLLVGSVLGYILGIISAWIISSIAGFMQIQLSANSNFFDYLRFDSTAFFLPFCLVSLILIIVTFKKGKRFINQEVTEGVSRREIKKQKFFKRHKLDIVFFIISLSGLVLVAIDLLNLQVQIPIGINILIYITTPFLFWIGGSSVGSRIVKWLPLKLEGVFLRLPMFKDVKNVIKSGLKRRGDIERLAVIIIMTLSIASLATIQGNTDETLAQRKIEWEIGADWQVNFESAGDYYETIQNISGFDDSIAISQTSVQTYSSEFAISAIDNLKELENIENGNPIALWQKDTFNKFTPKKALQALKDNPKGIFVYPDVLFELDVQVGDSIDISFPGIDSSEITVTDITILGIVNELPGGISGTTFISKELFLQVLAQSLNQSSDYFANSNLNGTRYLVRTTDGASISQEKISEIQLELDTNTTGIKTHRSFQDELGDINTTKQGYGITGLLSLNFIISLIAALVSAFSFSAILMERRKHEFAILRSIGAKKRHIYKMALGENALMMLTASVWGIFIGIGVSYLFNGVFEFISIIMNLFTGGSVVVGRTVIVPGLELLLISAVTFIGMLLATMLSVKSAANQDLSLATKVV
ncbi:FtsX-like permease family protein [Candidatus Lokiarchaeum ossiferum]|uniref:FtsX-like permease family protein n=1 Tax=Candidatus Lokiarchaeum ossiferum TaxID=2951803 RepID=UPI00352D00F6